MACGTYAGYQRHRRREETACVACVTANADYHRDLYASSSEYAAGRKARSAARRRALARLSRAYPVEFRLLYEEELQLAKARIADSREAV